SAVPEVTVVQPAPPGTTTAVVTESKLSAANMAALVLAANNATIERAQYARTHAASPEVRAFADRIFSESQAANLMLAQLFATYDVTPQPEATARLVSNNAAKTVSLMQAARGHDVDRIYLEAESANHRWLIGTLNSISPALLSAGAERELDAVRTAL